MPFFYWARVKFKIFYQNCSFYNSFFCWEIFNNNEKFKLTRKILICGIITVSFFSFFSVVSAVDKTKTEEIISNDIFEREASFWDFKTLKQGKSFLIKNLSDFDDFSWASGDVNGDGRDEIIIGASVGKSPKVLILNEKGEELSSFLAYNDKFLGGVNVYAFDLDHNGQAEIITGAGVGGGPHIRVFNYQGKTVVNKGFFAFDSKDTGGVEVFAADIDGNKLAEIIVVSDIGKEKKIKIFDRLGKYTDLSFTLKDFDSYTGINLAMVDFNGDGVANIVVSGKYNNSPAVKVFDKKGQTISQFDAYEKDFLGGVNLSKTIDSRGRERLITTTDIIGNSELKVFDISGNVYQDFFPFLPEQKWGVKILFGDFNGDKKKEYLTTFSRQPEKTEVFGHLIEVNLTTQQMFLYDQGFLINKFLISSGKTFPTPSGDFKIYRKRPSVHMTGFYSEGSSLNYDLPNVPWVMSFKGAYTFHGTYWHHNFGHPMSHGCVNMYTPDAEWAYNWTKIGDAVMIK